MKAVIENVHRIDARGAVYSLYLEREVLGPQPAGIAADVVTDSRIFTVSRLEGEAGWTVDGEMLANGLPLFFNGEGSRCTLLRRLDDAEIVAALDAATSEVLS